MVYAIIFGIILSLVHLFGKKIYGKDHKNHEKLISLGAGIFLAFIFIELLEELTEGYFVEGVPVFIFLLFGFSVFHILNKYIYLHAGNAKERKKELMELHYLGFSVDSFFAGLALALVLETVDLFVGLILLIPFVLHSISLSISISQLHEKFRVNIPFKLFNFKLPFKWSMSFLPLLGVLAAPYLTISPYIFYSTLAFITGMILYIAVRHMVPKGTRGKPLWYILGVIIGAVLLSFA